MQCAVEAFFRHKDDQLWERSERASLNGDIDDAMEAASGIADEERRTQRLQELTVRHFTGDVPE